MVIVTTLIFWLANWSYFAFTISVESVIIIIVLIVVESDKLKLLYALCIPVPKSFVLVKLTLFIELLIVVALFAPIPTLSPSLLAKDTLAEPHKLLAKFLATCFALLAVVLTVIEYELSNIIATWWLSLPALLDTSIWYVNSVSFDSLSIIVCLIFASSVSFSFSCSSISIT